MLTNVDEKNKNIDKCSLSGVFKPACTASCCPPPPSTAYTPAQVQVHSNLFDLESFCSEQFQV